MPTKKKGGTPFTITKCQYMKTLMDFLFKTLRYYNTIQLGFIPIHY